MYDAWLLLRATVPPYIHSVSSQLYSYTDGPSDILGLTGNPDSRRPRTIFLILLHSLDTVASGTKLKHAIPDALD